MHTEHCVIGASGVKGAGCTAQRKKYRCRKGHYALQDRKNERFPIIADCSVCRMEILSHKTTDKIDLIKKIEKKYPDRMPAARICIYDETAEQVMRVLKELC